MSVSASNSQSLGVSLGGGFSSLYGAREYYMYAPSTSVKTALSIDFSLRHNFFFSWDNQFLRLGAKSNQDNELDRKLNYVGMTVRAGKAFASGRFGVSVGPYVLLLTNTEVANGKFSYKLNKTDSGLSTVGFYQRPIGDNVLRLGLEFGIGFIKLKNLSGSNVFVMIVATWFFKHSHKSDLMQTN